MKTRKFIKWIYNTFKISQEENKWMNVMIFCCISFPDNVIINSIYIYIYVLKILPHQIRKNSVSVMHCLHKYFKKTCNIYFCPVKAAEICMNLASCFIISLITILYVNICEYIKIKLNIYFLNFSINMKLCLWK